jgi:TrmH family RNA methyltransferase
MTVSRKLFIQNSIIHKPVGLRLQRVLCNKQVNEFLIYIQSSVSFMIIVCRYNLGAGLRGMNNILINKLFDKYRGKMKHAGSQHPVMHLIKHILNNTSEDSEKLLVADGMWAHQKLLKTDLNIRCFLVCPELIYSNEGLELVESFINRAEETFIISGKMFERISDRDGPDGLISLVQIPHFDIDKLQLRDNALALVLDGLENPGNIGTILRTCDGAGVDVVFICNKRARLTNPKLVKGSMGAVFTIPIIEFNDMGVCAKWLKAHNFSIYLADTRANETYKSFDYDGNTALVMGSERYGISGEWYFCNPQLLSIPMLGICDSLNVGVAASVITYEISMKRLQKGCGT